MRVVHCKHSSYTRYIGRPDPLGNPFSHKPSRFSTVVVASREEAIARFEQYARDNLEVLEEIDRLKEQDVLGCWCKPLDCHGDVIVKIWMERRGKGREMATEEKSESIKFAELPLISKLPTDRMKKAKKLLEELEQLQTQKELIEERWDEAREELGKIQADAGLPGLRFGLLSFAQVEMPGRETIDKVKLIEAGVSAEQIRAGMKVGKPYVQRTFKLLKG